MWFLVPLKIGDVAIHVYLYNYSLFCADPYNKCAYIMGGMTVGRQLPCFVLKVLSLFLDQRICFGNLG
jgi:hypothetical protein